MTGETLEPGLTKADKRVLAVVPSAHDVPSPIPVEHTATVWEIAERLDTLDLADLRRTLSGLDHLGYTMCSTSASRKRIVWWRTEKGNAAVA